VSVIIVPRGAIARPLPSLELIGRVQSRLEAQSVPTANISVVGPLYIRVDVEMEIALASLEGAGAVQQAVLQKLAAFLHPLTGGLDGDGWDFGRRPHRSDLFALIEAAPGVDHINRLKLSESVGALDESAPELKTPITVDDVIATGRFLVYSGAHTVDLTFEEE
jgi:hypothetical protein